MSDLVLRAKNDECDISIVEIENKNGIRIIKVDIEFAEKKTPQPMSFTLSRYFLPCFIVLFLLVVQAAQCPPTYSSL